MDRSRIYKVRGKRWKGAVGLCLAAVLAMAVLTGCTRKTAATTGSRTVDKEYTKGQMMVIAITERNRYQNIYSSELWSVKADENGDTFEDKLMDQVEQFLIELATTNLMADEQGIELTSQEKDSLKSLAQEYYRNLSEQDRRFMDVSEDEVYDLYCQYYRADKLVAELTKNENLEVSDAEAKVIGIQQIELDSRAEAENVLALAQAEKADFGAIAAKYSKNSRTDRTLEWQKDMDTLERAAFELEQDQVSGILEQGGRYYILKCVNAYDEEATAARKSRLAQEKKTKAFLGIYEPYVKEHTVKLKKLPGDVVEFSGGEGCTADNFFQLYHGYFSK